MLLPGWTPLVRRLCAFALVLILLLITTYHYYPISAHPAQRITSNTAHSLHANLNTSKLALLIENRPSRNSHRPPAFHFCGPGLLALPTDDSILCANSRRNLDDWLEYDWVGAPWNRAQHGGQRRPVPAARKPRARNHPREPSAGGRRHTGRRVAHRTHGQDARRPDGERDRLVEVQRGAAFRAEREDRGGGGCGIVKGGELVKGIDDWREGGYEPMVITWEAAGSGCIQAWGNPEARQHIWKYCPEVKMILKMDAERYVPGGCGTAWKRDAEFEDEDVRLLDRLSAW
ncbi:hypothetical protein B0O99DRAFT_682265 [Bisporella sp. PMI_857]|nr:hypothetical protein B0O99DRAFT_682724 [Bisporella sp. PMI_857]KAH8600575.1 hypothetical protein B0O99DRAFT_682265 [Bisporella sp. PMI_857]